MRKLYQSLILLLLLRSVSFAQHEIDLKFDNPQCKSDTSCISSGAPSTVKNCVCSTEVYRTSCSSGTCPNSGTALNLFTLLSNASLTTLTDTTGTHWKYVDTDVALTDNSMWTYAVRNNWADQTTPTNPSSFVNTSMITIPSSVTHVHNATLNYSSTSCNLNTQCWIQIYRSICNPTCQPYRPGSSYWTDITDFTTTTYPVWSTYPDHTVWQIQDADTALTGSTTYQYVATLCYQPNCVTYSPASTPWSGTTLTRSKKGAKK